MARDVVEATRALGLRDGGADSGFDSNTRAIDRFSSLADMKQLKEGEGRFVGLARDDSARAASYRRIYECEEWLHDQDGNRFELGEDGKLRPIGEPIANGLALVDTDGVIESTTSGLAEQPSSVSHSVENMPGIDLAIKLGLNRRALATNAIERLIERYGRLEAVREELAEVKRAYRPEDRWSSERRAAYLVARARIDELIAVERLLDPGQAPSASVPLVVPESQAESVASVQVGEHSERRIARRAFFRRAGDRISSDTALVIVGGGLAMFGLRAYSIRFAALQQREQNDARPASRSTTNERVMFRQAWLPQGFVELKEEPKRIRGLLDSDRMFFDELAGRGFENEWFAVEYDMMGSVDSKRISEPMVVICRPGRSPEHASLLRVILRSMISGTIALELSGQVSNSLSALNIQKIPAEWARQPFEAIVKVLQQRADVLDPDFDDARAISPASIFKRDPRVYGLTVKH